MKKLSYTLLFIFLFGFELSAQNNTWIYATMEADKANQLRTEFPEAIQILDATSTLAAVHINFEAIPNWNPQTKHGPGYIMRDSSSTAIEAIHRIREVNRNVLDFTITEQEFVFQCINQVNPEKIGETILFLENFGTRFHDQSEGIQVPNELKAKWENLVNLAERQDISIEMITHPFTQQKSIILSIPGVENPDEIVVIGAHLDSGDNWNRRNAPGADDNASGVATITEVLRVLLANGFKPNRTVQFMAYAAEEIGLKGSQAIAQQYKNQNKNVLGVLNFDMVNYPGSDDDIFLVSDSQYVSSELNLFLVELLEHYHSSGDYALTYQHSECGYACSDHASWNEYGYMAVYPFEAAEGEYNPFYHTPNDTYARMNNDASHSAKFARLGLEFLIEIAKTSNLDTEEAAQQGVVQIALVNNRLVYDFKNLNPKLESLSIVDISASVVLETKNLLSSGSIDMRHLKPGVYVAVFKGANGKVYTKKFLKK